MRDFFHTGLNVSRSDLAGAPFAPYGKNPTGAEDYFVDGNVLSSQHGTSFDSPVKTLTEAIVLSNASIGNSQNRWWARRNRIFCMGDSLTENINVMPQKCDVIGLGSYNAFSGLVGIKGNHVPISGGSGTRFYNCLFFAASASGDLWTISSAQSNVEFHGCYFSAATGGTPLTGAIVSTASRFLKVIECQFAGIYSDAVIEFGAGNASGALIRGNLIQGNQNGIDINGSTTSSPEVSHIDNNIFYVQGIIVNDDSDLFVVTNNIGYTAVATTTAATYVEAWDCNVKLAFNNFFSAGDVTNCRFPKLDETGT